MTATIPALRLGPPITPAWTSVNRNLHPSHLTPNPPSHRLRSITIPGVTLIIVSNRKRAQKVWTSIEANSP